MSETPFAGGDDDRLLRSSILSDPRHRRIIAVLMDHDGPMTEREVAVRVATRGTDIEESEVSEEQVERLRIELHHQQLPKLTDVGWVERRSEGMVALDKPPFRSTSASEALTEGSDRTWETLAAVLARPRRRRILSVIGDRDGPIDLDELASEIDTGGVPREGSLDLVALLHHVDLPKLDEVGAITYDSDTRTVTADASVHNLVSWIDCLG